jgi:ribosomal protein L29
MELHKLEVHEIRSWEKDRMAEAENDIRKQIANLRMDVYTSKAQQSSKTRGLKKSLARILTIRQEKLGKEPATAAPAASPKTVAPKAAKTKAASKAKAAPKASGKKEGKKK